MRPHGLKMDCQKSCGPSFSEVLPQIPPALETSGICQEKLDSARSASTFKIDLIDKDVFWFRGINICIC